MPTARRIALGIAALVSTIVLGQCKRIDPVNVVIVTIDTTRADHLSCYGHPTAKTPAIDALAEEGVLFENAFTPVPITLPSHSTIMTGKVPFAHGIRDNALFILADEQITLAERLAEAGYSCGAAIGAFPLLSRFGIDQGFEFYDERLGEEFEDISGNRVIRKQKLFFDERKAGLVNEAAFPWLEENAESPFFLWLHYFDPHHPHEAPPPYSHEFASDPYLAEIAYADECVGQVVAKLRELGVYENTLLIVTADHGEGNGEHNEPTHSLLAYNSTLHIPLVIKAPGGAAGLRIEDRVGTADLVPTILERIGVEPDGGLQGRSLLPFLQGKMVNESPPLYAETLSPRLSHGLGEIRTIYDGDYKYHHGPRKELFHLGDDPGEVENLIESEPKIASELRTKLENYIETHAPDEVARTVTIDEETTRRLMALGYLGSSGTVEVGSERLRDDGIAPQERVANNGLLSAAKQYLHNRQPVRARTVILDLLERAPDDPVYLMMLAECERLSGDLDAAVEAYENLIEHENATAVIKPEDILLKLGELHFLKKDFDRAGEFIREAQRFHETAEAHLLLSAIYEASDNRVERRKSLEKATAVDSGNPKALLDLAVLLAEDGENEKAAMQFEKLLAQAPYWELPHYNYAVLQVQIGNPDKALELAERATVLNPGHIMSHYLQFEILRGSGDIEASETVLAEAAAVAPAHPLVKAMRALSK